RRARRRRQPVRAQHPRAAGPQPPGPQAHRLLPGCAHPPVSERRWRVAAHRGRRRAAAADVGPVRPGLAAGHPGRHRRHAPAVAAAQPHRAAVRHGQAPPVHHAPVDRPASGRARLSLAARRRRGQAAVCEPAAGHPLVCPRQGHCRRVLHALSQHPRHHVRRL
ncbi:hypothetical protein H4R21_005627, partial [Coemansia helicoidea]